MYRVILMLAGAAIVGLVLVLFSLNRHEVAVEFPMFTIQVPLNKVLALCFALSVGASLLFTGRMLLNCRKRARELKDRAALAEQEVLHLRRNVIQD